MSATDSDISSMLTPPHLGELIRENMEAVGWTVAETAAHLGCERGTLSRLLNGRAGVSPNMALALEAIGWGTAEHWMRMQANYELAKVRRELEEAHSVVVQARSDARLDAAEAMAIAVRETRSHRQRREG